MAGVALSQQIADDITKAIRADELRPGAVIPSERELRERYQTTKSTVNRAVSLLLAEGLVRTEPGRGVFVQDIPTAKRTRRIPSRGRGSGSSFAEEMRKIGYEPSTKLVQVELVAPPAEVARRLEIGGGDQALIRKRHMFADERPVQIASAYYSIPVAGGVELAHPDTGPTGIYERLAARGFPVARFAEEIESRRPTREESDFLRISPSQHVLEVTRLAYDPVGRVLEVTVNVFPSQLWRLSYEWSAQDD
jgi:GntR family transcriptional regulator